MTESEIFEIRKKKHEAFSSRKGLLVSFAISLMLCTLIVLVFS